MMKRFLSLLATLLIAAPFSFADDKPAEEKPAQKKAEAKAEADPEAKAKQAAQTLEALGQVFEVFGAALGGRAMIAEEAIVVEGGIVDLAVAAPAEGGEAVGDPLEQQFLQQFRQLSKTELNFVRAVCRPNKEQDKKIKTASDAALK